MEFPSISPTPVSTLLYVIYISNFHVVPLYFILSFYLLSPSRAQEAWAVGAPMIRGAQTGRRARPRRWPATCAAPSSPSSRGSEPAESAAMCSAPCASPRSHRPGESHLLRKEGKYSEIILSSDKGRVLGAESSTRNLLIAENWWSSEWGIYSIFSRGRK